MFVVLRNCWYWSQWAAAFHEFVASQKRVTRDQRNVSVSPGVHVYSVPCDCQPRQFSCLSGHFAHPFFSGRPHALPSPQKISFLLTPTHFDQQWCKCVCHRRVDGCVLPAPEAPPTIKVRCRGADTEGCIYSLAILGEWILARCSAVYFHCIKFTMDFVSTPPKQLLSLLVGPPLQTPQLLPYEWLPGDPDSYCCCCWLPVMGEFQTFLVLHSLGLTVIFNNELELVAAASHPLEGFLLAAASCLCWCSWMGLPCGQAEIQRNPLCSQGRDAPVRKLSWNESDWRCDWIIEQRCSSPEQRGSEVQYQLGGLAVEISPKLRLWWCARVSGSANSCQNKALSA